jgi:dTDP-4-amino-4,6-dideoxygalactose transaminase
VTKGGQQTRMTIPFLDLARLHRTLVDELEAEFRTILGTSGFIGGAACASFERAFATAHGAPAAAGCGSGTDALTLALTARGIAAGDEVIVPAMTFVASAEAVVHAGATPVLADVDAASLLLTDEGVRAARTPRTRAVLPVHLYGHVVAFDLLERWRDEGLIVVEDAAQAHLATWQGRTVGSAGDAACFSFYPGKNLGALGDGGAVVSADQGLIDRIASLRDHGSTRKYLHDEIGWCSRLDGLQAAWLEVKLRHLPAWTERRRALAERYRQQLPPGLLVDWEAGAVHHLLVIRVPAPDRERIGAGLADAGVQTGIHYPFALSQQPALGAWTRPCPNAERAASEVLSLPLDPLMTDGEVDEVVAALTKLLG